MGLCGPPPEVGTRALVASADALRGVGSVIAARPHLLYA